MGRELVVQSGKCGASVHTLPFMTVFLMFCTLEWLFAALMAFEAAVCVRLGIRVWCGPQIRL